MVSATSNLMNNPLFVIVDKVIKEIRFPRRPSVSVAPKDTPATQNLKEVTKVSFLQLCPQFTSGLFKNKGRGVVEVDVNNII